MVIKKEGKQAKDLKIGVVDDDFQTAVSISQLLEFNGFKTFQAYNSQEALAKTKEQRPDLLLVDIWLREELNGYGLAKLLPNQKIIFFTGYEIDNKKIKEFKNVITALRKPVDIYDLLKILRKEFNLPDPRGI